MVIWLVASAWLLQILGVQLGPLVAGAGFVGDEQWRPWLLDEPEIWGVEGLGPASATIRLGLKTAGSRSPGSWSHRSRRPG